MTDKKKNRGRSWLNQYYLKIKSLQVLEVTTRHNAWIFVIDRFNVNLASKNKFYEYNQKVGCLRRSWRNIVIDIQKKE